MRWGWLVASALALVAGCAAANTQLHVEPGRAVIRQDGRTIEITGPVRSVVVDNGRISLQWQGEDVVIDRRRLILGGRTHDLPEYRSLAIGTAGAKTEIRVDGRPFP